MSLLLTTILVSPGGAIVNVELTARTFHDLGCHTICIYAPNQLNCKSIGPTGVAGLPWQTPDSALREWVLAPEQREALIAGVAQSLIRATRHYTHVIMSGPVNLGTCSRDEGSYTGLAMAELVVALVESGEGAVITTPISRNDVHGDRHLSLVQTWIFIPKVAVAHSIPNSAITHGLENAAEKAGPWLKKLKVTSVEQAHNRLLNKRLCANNVFRACFNFFGNYS